MSRIDDRYASPGRGRRLLQTALVAALAAVGMVWLVLTALHWATPEVTGRVKAYVVQGTNETQVTLTVDRRDASTPVACKVFVQAADFERVGEKEITVGPGTERVSDHTFVVRTFRQGTSASFDSCRVTG